MVAIDLINIRRVQYGYHGYSCCVVLICGSGVLIELTIGCDDVTKGGHIDRALIILATTSSACRSLGDVKPVINGGAEPVSRISFQYGQGSIKCFSSRARRDAGNQIARIVTDHELRDSLAFVGDILNRELEYVDQRSGLCGHFKRCRVGGVNYTRAETKIR